MSMSVGLSYYLFRMLIAIFTITLATAASTIPIISLDHKINGTIIALTKRSPWLNLDNSVKFDALHFHVESAHAKMLRGLENYERNTGMRQSRVAVKGGELLDLKERAVGTAALTSHNTKVWYGTITIGTPPKSYTVEFDTGISDFFLPGPACSGCSENTPWDPASSSTARTKGSDSTFSFRFTDGAAVSGNQYTDNVTVAGLTADTQTIGVATSYSSGMGFPPDGTIGMAFQSISMYPASPVFKTLVDEGKVTEPVFSVKLTSDGGELILGGTNSELYEGEIIYTPVTLAAFWQVNIMEIQGDHETLLTHITAIIDTGTDFILGDPSQVASLHHDLGAKTVGKRGYYYSFPCDDFPTISFSFGGDRVFEIPPSILRLGPVRTGSLDCFSGIVGMGRPGLWTLGGVFLQSVYTVFDMGNERVGFANLV